MNPRYPLGGLTVSYISELSSDCGVQSTTSKVPEDEMKDVVNKLVKHYNIDKLKDLTRVRNNPRDWGLV